jgi:oxygen-dependent protoporphyrinogen oxidase
MEPDALPVRDAIVVGAGVSGLAAAFGLEKRGFDVELLEAAARAGGVIESRRRDGFLYETGPNSTLDTTPLIAELLRDVGIENERANVASVGDTRYIVRNGRLVPLPTSPGAFLTTPAFSLGAKLKLLREPFIAAAPADAEESVADFVRRRLGQEFLDYAVDPFVAGIYAGDPERISVKAAFPRLHALEQKYGSLIKGQIKGAKERRANAEQAKNVAKSFSFRSGMQTITDALARAVTNVATGVRVERVARANGGYVIEATRDGAPLVRHARAVIVATPAYAAAPIVQSLAPDASRELAAIGYAPVAVVATAYRRTDVAHPLDGFGFLVPKKERRAMLGTLFSSSMFDGRAPGDSVLVTSFVGGRRDPERANLPDERLAELVARELASLVGAVKPIWTEVVRWPRAIPQYDLGHLARLVAVEAAEASLPGLRFCANYRGGVSMGDCVKSAHATVEALAEHLADRGT